MIDQISALSSSSNGLFKGVSETRYTSGPTEAGGVDMGGIAPVDGPSFSDTLADVSMDAVEKIREGEATALAGVNGQASVQQVVEAVMAAEASVRTAVAIRDKVVGAYQEISRMTI